MAWIKNTISKRLFVTFGILAVNVIILSGLSYHFIDKTRLIHDQTHRIEGLRIQMIRILKADLDFLRFETHQTSFYETQSSETLVKRDMLYRQLEEDKKQLRVDLAEHQDLHNALDSIDHAFTLYNSTFREVVQKVIIRGFKDYGLEGTMRNFAHELENADHGINLSDVLMLRRHEKDYFLRKEEQYKIKFNALANSVIKNCKEANNDAFAIHLVTSYQSIFNHLTQLDEELGLTPAEGLVGKLNDQTNRLSAHMEELVKQSQMQADAIIRRSLVSTILFGAAFIIASFTLTYITALRLARPIKKLSSTIDKFMINQGLREVDLNDATVADEIGNLSQAFIKMTRKLKAQFDEIEENSELLEKRNYELQKLNEELDRFIYSSAHDLKSPLASIEGLINLARREINLAEHDHYFDKMVGSVHKMEGFIRDITDYAKNKRQTLRIEKINMQEFVERILLELNYMPGNDRIQKKLLIEDGDFYTDLTRLEIIFKNIISNAIRYADLSKVNPNITVSVKMTMQRAIISIEDNGIGIDQKHINRIFDMFYRAVEHAKGSGLGLFLVRESVKMLRGTIQVSSQLHEGTTFTLQLPNLQTINVNITPETNPVQFKMVEATM